MHNSKREDKGVTLVQSLKTKVVILEDRNVARRVK